MRNGFMVPISLGLQGLFHNPGRALTVIVLVGLSVSLFLTMLRARTGVAQEQGTLRSLVATTLDIRPTNSPMALAEGEPIPAEAVAKMETVPNVVRLEPYLRVRIREPNLPASEALGQVIVNGMGPGMPLRVSSHGTVVSSRVVAGNGAFGPEDMGKNVALVGTGFAERHNISPVSLGSVALQDSTKDTKFQATEVRVIGIFETGFVFGDNQIFLPVDTLRRVSGSNLEFSEVFVIVDSVENVARVEKDLKVLLGNKGDVLPLSPIATVAAGALNSVEGNVGIVAVVTLIAGTVIIFLLMVLITRERKREIGILQALGGSNRDVAGQFATEGLAQAVLGGLVGFGLYLAAGPFLAALIVTPLGYGARRVSGIHGENPIPAILSTTSFGASAEYLGIALGVALITALLGTLYTVLRIIRLRPVEAIRG